MSKPKIHLSERLQETIAFHQEENCGQLVREWLLSMHG